MQTFVCCENAQKQGVNFVQNASFTTGVISAIIYSIRIIYILYLMPYVVIGFVQSLPNVVIVVQGLYI